VPRGVVAEAQSRLLLVYQLGLLHLRQGIHLPRPAAAAEMGRIPPLPRGNWPCSGGISSRICRGSNGLGDLEGKSGEFFLGFLAC
jgi:hypothetical protein